MADGFALVQPQPASANVHQMLSSAIIVHKKKEIYMIML